ncbi:hypothetical protein VOLCADRAFT_91237 [Volvox carteri f. nagariensis]|uniref:Pherophorin domain-containing protein n=1 Tax=Volvox carteri f. nagariensis TaxID=3068 RepID=D8TWJ1_VOLCA|nr:uncharacterized protein VOLCADRAFT_91237 [Volvox carteri f. nagariensis]EFJ48163.1 hypothetical protein VOLCADRAFT_91237 [Volvox carteri f. nagariensis]|eukprot:XP_002950848.1 hypothetical protein VOLCADRAFT_91237 [Volvox carteri f. nagariensis]
MADTGACPSEPKGKKEEDSDNYNGKKLTPQEFYEKLKETKSRRQAAWWPCDTCKQRCEDPRLSLLKLLRLPSHQWATQNPRTRVEILRPIDHVDLVKACAAIGIELWSRKLLSGRILDEVHAEIQAKMDSEYAKDGGLAAFATDGWKNRLAFMGSPLVNVMKLLSFRTNGGRGGRNVNSHGLPPPQQQQTPIHRRNCYSPLLLSFPLHLLLVLLLFGSSAQIAAAVASPPPPPPMPPLATCGPYPVLYRDGVPVSAIRAPVISADYEDAISPAFLLQVVDVPRTRRSVGYYVNGTTTIVVQWKFTDRTSFSYGMLSEADFNAVYNGTSGCREPSGLTAMDYGQELDYASTAYFPIFEVAPPSYSSLVQPCGAPVTFYWFTSFLSHDFFGVAHVSWAAADWVHANDTTNPICPDSPTAWGYTKFAISYCPCPAQPPPPSPPPPPPMPPLPSCGDFPYVTYNGVPVTGYPAPVRSSVTGQVVTPAYIDASQGFPELVVDWQLESYVKYSFIFFPESIFLQIYNGGTGCRPPDAFMSTATDWVITTQGESPSPPPPAAKPPKAPRSPSSPKAPKPPKAPVPPKAPKPPKVPKAPNLSTPPPPVGNNNQLVQSFPFFTSCNARDVSLTPYRMSVPSGPWNTTASSATYCFRVAATATVNSASPCAGMTINRMEMIIESGCVDEDLNPIRSVTINGVSVVPLFSSKTWKGETYGIMTLRRLADIFPTTPSGGLYICLELARTSPCSTPAGMCYGNSCVFALSNDDFTCCPRLLGPLASRMGRLSPSGCG